MENNKINYLISSRTNELGEIINIISIKTVILRHNWSIFNVLILSNLNKWKKSKYFTIKFKHNRYESESNINKRENEK